MIMNIVKTAEMEKPITIFNTFREIPATVEEAFAAIQNVCHSGGGQPVLPILFSVCEFKNGGRWSFIMHGLDGKNYLNENVFAGIESPVKIIVQQVSEPKSHLTYFKNWMEGSSIS
jgi:hypothetical protein